MPAPGTPHQSHLVMMVTNPRLYLHAGLRADRDACPGNRAQLFPLHHTAEVLRQDQTLLFPGIAVIAYINDHAEPEQRKEALCITAAEQL